MRRIAPPAVRKRDLIAIAAPSGIIDKSLLDRGVKKIEGWGYRVRLHRERVLEKYRFFAGKDSHRAEDLCHIAKDKNINAIWCARGGHGATRILPLIEKAKIVQHLRQHPKLLIGYSDITALHSFVYDRVGLRSIHGALTAAHSLLDMTSGEVKRFQSMIEGTMPLGKNSFSSAWPTHFLTKKKTAVEGILLGGNLTVLTAMIGTPWQPKFKDAILVLEDCYEEPYRIDRMLTQMFNAGMLNQVRAVAAGDLVEGVDPRKQKKISWEDVLCDRFEPLGIPVIAGLAVGHGERNEPLPLGIRARITKRGKLEYLEQVVS